MPDSRLDAAQAFELKGASKVSDAHVMGLVVALVCFAYLDLTAPEAEPIVALLHGIPSALRFALDHNLNHFKVTAFNTRSNATVIASLVFGKEEDGGFSFTQQMVDDVLASLRDMITGHMSPFFASLPAHWFRPALHLCISGTPLPSHPADTLCL